MKRKISKKSAAIILSCSLILGVSLGGTLAWLTDKTSNVKNTFTVGNINIDLTESNAVVENDLLTNSYKMIPGFTIEKDPIVTVEENSEDCYLFIKAVKSNDFDDYMTYEIAEGWELVPGQTDVYYRIVEFTTTDIHFTVIKDNQVMVKDTVTKQMMDTLTAETYPTLTFTAYASQYYETNNTRFAPAEAWDLVKDLN